MIVDALASVQRQTARVDEIVVVDDASTDDTPGVVSALADSDSRIRLVRHSLCRGATAARNAGVSFCDADWIAFLDSDDVWVNTKIERQIDTLKRFPEAVACFTGIRYVSEVESVDIIPPAEVGVDLLRRSNELGSTSAALVSRDAFLRVGGFDAELPSCQDWDLWLKLAAFGPLTVVAEPLLLFNDMKHSRVSNNSHAVLAGHRVMRSRALVGVTSRRTRREILAHHHARLAQAYLWNMDNRWAALREALISMAIHPNYKARQILEQTTGIRLPRGARRSGL
jgi:GT2 family glycosyltransferase